MKKTRLAFAAVLAVLTTTALAKPVLPLPGHSGPVLQECPPNEPICLENPTSQGGIRAKVGKP